MSLIRRKPIALRTVAAGVLAVSAAAAVVHGQAAVSPRLSLTANAGRNVQVYQGSPLLLNATVYNSARSSKTVLTPLLINAQNGSWANAVQLFVVNASGTRQNWSFQLIAPPVGSLTLDQTVGNLTWVLAPSATSSIAPGSYTAGIELDTTASAGTSGWKGTTISYTVSIQIASLPSPLTADQQEAQATLLATYDHLQGNDTQAVADLDAFLSQNSTAVGALSLKGNLLAGMGQTSDALDAYDGAVSAFYAANPSAPEEPDALLIAQGQVRSTLLSQTGKRGVPQVQINLQDQGTQSPGVFFLDLQITNIGADVAQNVLLNQLALKVLDGSGQVFTDNLLSPQPPIATDFLGTNASTTVRIFVRAQGTVNSASLTESGTAVDIFGTPAPFSQTQTVSLNSSGGGTSPGALTITAPTVNQLYGQATPAINNVSYSGFVNGDGPSSLAGALSCVTPAKPSSPVGTYSITCSGLSSPNYTIAFVPGTLSVTTASLAITANSTTRQFGQSNPSFTASYGGFANSDTPSSLAGALSCTSAATPSSSAGSYPITCAGLSSPNYSITYLPGALTIKSDTLTVTANNAVRQYGSANPSFTASFAGFVNGDTPASLGGSLACATTAAQSSAVGTYPITCSGLSSPNYAITYVAGQLTISPPLCAANATAAVSITRSGFSYSVISKRYAQTVTLTNTSGSALTGPIYVVLDSLSSNASLYNSGGSTACAAPLGSPYVSVTGTLSAGASTTLVLQFTDPVNSAIGYTTRVLSGAGQP
jgi:hypothetical protein